MNRSLFLLVALILFSGVRLQAQESYRNPAQRGVSLIVEGFAGATQPHRRRAGLCSAHPCGPLNLPDLSNGHTFLIDGYNNALVKYTYVYEWVYDNVDPEQMVDLIEPIIEISYAWHPTNQISMNWGWGGAYNSVLFSYTGDWNVGGYNFEYYRNILYNFAEAE